jgi:hypothetical protein
MVDINFKNEKLAISIDGTVYPFTSIVPTITTGATPLDVIEEDNVGFHLLPPRFTLSGSIHVTGDGPVYLQNAQLTRKVDLELGISRKTGESWAFEAYGFSQGTITSSTISGIESGNFLPIMTIEAAFLNYAPAVQSTVTA